MSDETKTVVVTETQKPEEKLVSQSEVDRIISQRLAREKEKYSDYEELKKKAETLEAEKKQRQEAELTEVEKLKNKQSEYEQQLNDIVSERDKLKSYKEEMEQRLLEQVDKAMDGLSDDDKDIINDLPLEKRLIAINRLKDTKPSNGKWGKGQGQPAEKDLKEKLLAAKTPREREAILREEYKK